MKAISKPEPSEYASYTIIFIGLLPQIYHRFIHSFDDRVLTRSGVTSGNVISVRAAAYHIAGHELRHLNVIKERYLSIA